MRSILIGLFAGLLLSALRAPAGLELLQIPAAAAGATAAYRAAALFVIALGLILGSPSNFTRFSPIGMLVGAATGYQLHWQMNGSPGVFGSQVVLSCLLVALLIGGHQGGSEVRPRKARSVLLVFAALLGWSLVDTGFPEGHSQAVLVGITGLIALAIVGRCTGVEQAPDDESLPQASPLRSGGLSAIAVCGAGMALFVEGIARQLNLLGGGLPADDSVFGTVFLAFAAFAAFAFTRNNMKSPGAVQLGRAITAALGAAVVGVTLKTIANLGTNRGLDLYLRDADSKFGDYLPLSAATLDLSVHGTLEYDLAIAAPILILPAFICGALIGLHRKSVELAALLIGASGGVVLAPRLLKFDWISAQAIVESNPTALAVFGAMLASIGALIAIGTSVKLSRLQRSIGLAFALAGIGYCHFGEFPTIKILSPWEKREAQILAAHETPVGLVTVERDGAGSPFATLKRRAITPPTEHVRGDLDRLRQSWAMLGPLDDGVKPKVLFVGQLNPARALTLVDLGAGPIDRTAAWVDSMAMIEEQLFEGTPTWFPGEILPLADARAKLGRGEYDLVIVPAVFGPAPTTRNLASPSNTTVVAWFDGACGVETQHMGSEVMVTAPGLTGLFVAVAKGPQVDKVKLNGGWGAPGFLPIGEPLKPLQAVTILNMREKYRGDLHRGRLASRLAAAERSPGLGEGLTLHFRGQVPSSPFDSPALMVELTDEASERFSAAATGAEPSALAVEVIETLAYLYGEQRGIEEIDRYLAAPAGRHTPWPALEIALAQASLEFLEPEAAVESLARAHSTWGGTPASLAMQAEAQAQTGDNASAVESLLAAIELAPHHHELERRLAIALVRAGDERGAQALAHAIEENPGDESLGQYAKIGPYPPPPAGFHPLSMEGDDGHGGH